MSDIVLLDVNGTLIPADPAVAPDRDATRQLRHRLVALRARGVRVGLCSDSPLEQLRGFGHRIGLGPPATFPLLAENGNVVGLDGRVRVTTPFPDRDRVRAVVSSAAAGHGLTRTDDVIAVEFGGRRLGHGEWGFGANRRASVSVFGPRTFIAAAEAVLARWTRGAGLSVDASLERGFLGIHPYAPAHTGKARAVTTLARAGHRVLLVGDSRGDWVPDPAVCCAFVGETAITDDIRAAAWHVSTLPDVEGVVDILDIYLDRLTDA